MDRQKSIFDKIGSLIPGYRGYAERDGRRNCDKLLRVGLADKLSIVESVLYDRINQAVKIKDKQQMRSLEDCRKQLNTFNSKIRFAPYGETSFFGDTQIKDEELLKIYLLDLELAEHINALSLNALDIGITELISLINRAKESLQKRNNYIKEFK